MAKGMEMLFTSMLKSMGFEPQMIVESFANIFRVAKSADDRLARIEAQLERIEALQRGEVLPTTQPHIIEGKINGTE